MTELARGPRLYLRKLNETDLDRTWEWLHRPDINSKIGVRIPFTKDEQKAWFAKLAQDDNKIVFAVCQISDGSHIGNLSLDMIDRRHRNARFSIFIAEEGERGKGLGSEAMGLLEEYSSSVLGLHKIWCKTDAGDPRVIRFYEKLGYRQEGLLREHELKNGRFVDKVLLGKILATTADEA